jgi:hypothetical protein
MFRILTKEGRTVDTSPAFGKKFQVGGAFVYGFVAYRIEIEMASGLVK